MIYLTPGFRRKLADDTKEYIATADITLASGEELSLSNTEIWGDGFSVEDAVSDDEKFTALGAAVINDASLVIDNTRGQYTKYDFMNADVVLKLALMVDDTTGTRKEEIKMGTFRVDDAKYNEATITLSMLDMMEQFDRPYTESTLVYPATLAQIVQDACTHCAVTLNTLSFPHSTYTIQERPTDEACTFREIIAWAATVAGCYARCNRDGELVLSWFNVAALEDNSGTDGGIFDTGTPYYTSGDSVDGGSFNPWNTGGVADGGVFTEQIPLHYLSGLYSQNICVDETVITGVTAEVEDPDAGANKQKIKYSTGTDGYVILISGNPFFTKTNAQTIVNWLGQQLVGLRFRKCNVTRTDDPSIEAGDVGILYDSRGEEYPILITRQRFEIGSPQTIVCGSDTPSHNSSTRFSAATKNYVSARKLLKEQKNSYDQAIAQLSQDVANAHGLYADEIEDPDNPGSNIYCLHDKPELSQSNVQIRVSTVGIVVTSNGTAQSPTWYGLRVNGDLIARVIQTMNLFFDYAHGGTLKLGGASNGNGKIEVYDASNNLIGAWDNSQFITKLQAFNSDNQYTLAYEEFKFYKLQNTDTTSKIYYVSSFFNFNSVKPYPVTTYSRGFFRTGRTYYSLFRLGYTNASISDSDQIGAFVAAHEQGGAFIAESHGIGSNASGNVEDIATQPLFIGIHTRCDDNDQTVYQAKILGRRLILSISDAKTRDVYGEVSVGRLADGTKYFGLSAGTGFYLATSGTTKLMFNGVTVATASSSSIRYKHNIKPIEDNELDPHKLLGLRVVQFEWNEDHKLQYPDMAGHRIPGIIAEDVAEIYPAAVIHDSETGEIESWDERRIIPGMLTLIQEQQKRLDDQQRQIDGMMQQIEELKKLVTENHSK